MTDSPAVRHNADQWLALAQGATRSSIGACGARGPGPGVSSLPESCADLVSVIIPCYNQARFVGETIESVLAQTHRRHEIIVVDDGSADDPASVVARYGVRFIRQERQGVATARNTGWHASHGAFTVFLDGDDRLLPEALAVGHEVFLAHPDCGFVFGHGRLIDPAGCEMLPNFLSVIPDAGGYEQLLERNPIAFPAVAMFRRDVMEAVGGFRAVVGRRRIDNTSDYDLYLRVAERFPIHSHCVLVAEWRQHGTNTSRNSIMMLHSALAVLKSQRLPPTDRVRHRAARQRGLKRVRTFYGERLIEELRNEVRTGQISWLRFCIGVLTLMRHFPSGLMENVARKTRRMIAGHPAGGHS